MFNASISNEFQFLVTKSIYDYFPSIPIIQFPGGIVVKNPPANAADPDDTGSNSGLATSPGGGNGNPVQYSCLENSMDIGA